VTDRSALSAASGEFDVVIHCVSSRGGDEEQYRRLYFGGVQNLLRAFSRATLLFTSSTSVYAQKDGSVVDECSPAEPRHEKGKILRETEELVLAAGGIVARLAGIHGPHRSVFLSRVLEGRTPPEGDDRFINQVHRDDIVSALLLVADRRAECRGEIFNVVADEPVKASAAYEWLSTQVKMPLVSDAADAGQRKRGDSNKQVSNRKLRALGWAPRYPTFESAMTESILPSFGL
jgi:nucleoside-diphosphate-sugar epimerase